MAFLKVEKDLFKLKLNPTEILVLAQVMEFDKNATCYMTDAQFAESFGVSSKTISRALEALEQKGFITRETKTVASKRVRTISPNLAAINKSNGQNVPLKDETKNLKQTICPSETDNLSNSDRQNDFIKENEKINKKDKVEIKPKEEGTDPKNPIVVPKEWLVERYNELQPLSNGLYYYNKKFYKEKASQDAQGC